MRGLASAVILVGLLVPASHGRGSRLPDSYALLSRLRSPYRLLEPHLPRRYRVPVTLSGSVAEEMAGALEEMGVRDFSYVEVYGGEGRFRLMLESPGLPDATRELLSGILNPIEMIETVLTSLLRHREEEVLAEMAGETRIDVSAVPARGKAFVQIDLTPRGKRFSYRYQDAGAYTREDWLTRLSLVVDTASMLVHELDLVKGERTIAAADVDRSEPETSRQRYVFVYRTIGEAAVPARLELHVNGQHTLTIGAAYRQREDYVLFAGRKIAYHLQHGDAELSMTYGRHDLEASRREVRGSLEPADHTKQLERAAELAREASRAFNDGHLGTAARILRELAKDYPGTPQGVEARKTLSGLRGGL